MASNPNKKILFWLFSFLGLGTAWFALPGNEGGLLGFLWSPVFLNTVRIFCVIALILLVISRLTQRPLPQAVLKWIFGILFLPLVLLPVFRCYFKVPYVFCRACPQPCPWGLCRTFIFNSFLLLNLSGRFWCANLCPIGTYQEGQTHLSKKYLKIFSWLFFSSYIILLLVAGMYLLTLFGSPWVAKFEAGRYAWGTTAVITFLAVFVLSFFVPKFGCRYICPVGAIAELTTSLRPSKKS